MDNQILAWSKLNVCKTLCPQTVPMRSSDKKTRVTASSPFQLMLRFARMSGFPKVAKSMR